MLTKTSDRTLTRPVAFRRLRKGHSLLGAGCAALLLACSAEPGDDGSGSSGFAGAAGSAVSGGGGFGGSAASAGAGATGGAAAGAGGLSSGGTSSGGQGGQVSGGSGGKGTGGATGGTGGKGTGGAASGGTGGTGGKGTGGGGTGGSGGFVSKCSFEGNCRCFEQLAWVMAGNKPDLKTIDKFKGSSDPAKMFQGGGSENIPLTCRTAKYYWDHDPKWLQGYLDIQLASAKPDFLGGEIFSSVYTALSVGDVMAAFKHARDKGHTQLANNAKAWLRRYWAYLALAALKPSPTSWTVHNVHGTQTGWKGTWAGYNISLVGTRCYVNGFGGSKGSITGSGTQGLLLAMALEHPSRNLNTNLAGASPGYWGGVRAMVESVGYKLDSKGKVKLTSKSIPASFYGLSEQERSKLASFVAAPSAAKLPGVVSMLGGQKLGYTITIRRSQGGVISWYGTSSTKVVPGNGRKGGSWATAKGQGKSAEFLTRSSDKWGGGDRGTVWREGSKICSQSSTLPKKCLDFPGGSLIYEVRIGPQGGAQCVAGC